LVLTKKKEEKGATKKEGVGECRVPPVAWREKRGGTSRRKKGEEKETVPEKSTNHRPVGIVGCPSLRAGRKGKKGISREKRRKREKDHVRTSIAVHKPRLWKGGKRKKKGGRGSGCTSPDLLSLYHSERRFATWEGGKTPLQLSRCPFRRRRPPEKRGGKICKKEKGKRKECVPP